VPYEHVPLEFKQAAHLALPPYGSKIVQRSWF
jgi:hypothetical protein